MTEGLVCAFLSSDSRIPLVKSRETWRTRKQTGSFDRRAGGGTLGLSDNDKQWEHVASMWLACRPVRRYKATRIPPLFKKKILPMCCDALVYSVHNQGKRNGKVFPISCHTSTLGSSSSLN